MSEVRYLRTPDAAAYLGTTRRFLEKLRSKGGGPKFCKIGGRTVVYPKDELDAWVKANTFESTSAYPS